MLYGDIFFFYNLIMDYIVLKMTAVLWSSERHRLFLWCIAANIGYLAAVCLAGLYAAMPYVFLALALVFGLRPKGMPQFIGMLLTSYIITFLLGSLALGLMAVFDANGFVIVIPALLLMYILDRLAKSPRLNAASGLYPLEIYTDKKKICMTALSDSGNDLRINGEPVIIADKSVIMPLLPYISDTFSYSCRTVTGEAELMCFYADVGICGKTKRACIAISGTPIKGSFEALINSEIIKL